LQAGFAEVDNWFKRNDVEIASEKEHWSVGNAMQHLNDQYGHVRAVLAKERELLETLVRYRSEKAEQWLRDDKK
jgi:hypothetical protein